MEEAGKRQRSDALSAALGCAADFLDGDPAQAEARVGEILDGIPGQPQAVLLLVCARRMGADKTGARAVLEALARHAPGLASVQYELGLVLGAIGETHSAIAALSRTVELEPNHPSAWRALGNQLARSGDRAAAGRAFARHIHLSLKELQLLENATRQDDQQPGPGENMLREFLKIHGTDPSATHMLARIGMQQGRYEDAEQLFARALELAPRFISARQDYTVQLQLQKSWKSVIEQADILLRQNPHDPSYLLLQAKTFVMLGEYDQAIARYEGLLADHPGDAILWTGYGDALRTIGRQGDAIAAYRRAVALRPDIGGAWWSLANLKTFRFTPAEIDTMKSLLNRRGAAEHDPVPLRFALGKALEDQQDYAQSFEYYRQANAIQRARAPYDGDKFSRYVRRCRALFTPGFFRDRAGVGSKAPDPIFIVGLARSGSTLIEQILASHPQIEGTMELPDIFAITGRLDARSRSRGELGYPETLGQLGAAEFSSLGQEYLERVRVQRKLGRPFFTDKLLNNFHHPGLIQLILPNAKIIDARRHPLACCFSNFKQHFPAGLEHTNDLGELGRYYHDYVELMAHFDAVLPGHIHRVFYEDMVRDPETEIRRLLDYCGVPFHEACLKFHENRRGVRTVSSEQVRMPLYTDALEQWRNFEPWLDPLKIALGSVLACYPAVPAF